MAAALDAGHFGGVAADSLVARPVGDVGLSAAVAGGVESVPVREEAIVAVRQLLWDEFRLAAETRRRRRAGRVDQPGVPAQIGRAGGGHRLRRQHRPRDLIRRGNQSGAAPREGLSMSEGR